MEQLLNQMNQLGLKGMAALLDAQQRQPEVAAYSFEERLSALLDAEQEERNERKTARLLRNAGLRYPSADLEDFIYTPQRTLDKSRIASLKRCEWVEYKQAILIMGSTGVGKSWLACAFGKEACKTGYRVRYMTAAGLFNEIQLSLIAKDTAKLKRSFAKTDLWIIDDFGLGDWDIDQSAVVFIELLDAQSANGGLIITSQRPKEQWHTLFGDATIADAVLDRILHRSHSLTLEGESMRKMESNSVNLD